MLRVIGLSLMLLGVAWLGCHVESPAGSSPIEVEREQWVRTVDGWESKRAWNRDASRGTALHPAILALGQTLVSIMALVVFCPTMIVKKNEPSRGKSLRRAARSNRSSSKRIGAATYR